MRCDNIIGGVPRKASRDFDLGGFKVEAGQTLMVPLTYLTRHDPRWDGDGSFEPARWLTEGGAGQGWVMPFGAGNRCGRVLVGDDCGAAMYTRDPPLRPARVCSIAATPPPLAPPKGTASARRWRWRR
jgi:hypothetical protein